jgi:hypothetical protein
MSNDQVTIWGAGLKFGRKPEDGELLIGNGVGFKLATLSPGSGISISNASGAITIAATGGGTVTAVTATSPLKSSGGTAPDISLSGTVAVSNGGTGQTSLTANNVILGDGTNAVKFVAPGTNGNLLTSNGTTWTSAALSNFTLLDTIATTSGTTATSAVLSTSYQQFVIYFLGVSHAAATVQNFQMALSSNGGSTYSAAVAIISSFPGTDVLDAVVTILNPKSTSATKFSTSIAAPQNTGSVSIVGGSFAVSGSINRIQFSVTSSTAFDAGSIQIYGVN